MGNATGRYGLCGSTQTQTKGGMEPWPATRPLACSALSVARTFGLGLHELPAEAPFNAEMAAADFVVKG
jgi:hypothetical protein